MKQTKQTKRTKEFVKNTLVAGIGLGVGASIIGKAPDSAIKSNALGAFNIASVGMTIGGAKYAMDSMGMLNEPKKKKRR